MTSGLEIYTKEKTDIICVGSLKRFETTEEFDKHWNAVHIVMKHDVHHI
jgi:hypothetical protein